MLQKILASIVLGITALAQVADAAVIYSQASATGTTSINSQGVIGGSDYDVIAFAAFTPTQSGTIDNISWQGTSNSLPAYAGFSDGFSIDVLEGPVVLPDSTQYAPISRTTITGTAGLANATLNANGMYDYNTDIKPFAVQAGVTYYISIRSNGIAPWGWASMSGDNTIVYYRGLAKFLSLPGVPVFSLNNVHNSAVAPAPVNPTNLTIIPVPAPVGGQVQGMITQVGNGFVIIDNTVVTHDGDTVKTFNGGLKTLAVGEMVNYTYTVDVDGVVLASTMDIYPAETITGTDRVNRIDVNNSTAVVALTLYRGPVVDFYQNSGIYVTGAGTNTSFGAQLVNYTGYINPTTGHIVASVSGYMSNIPVTFKPVLPAATVGKTYSQYSIDFSAYGMPNIYSVSATGLPPGMTNSMGVISGIPTTPGTYTVTLKAIGGQYNVTPYTQIGSGSVIIVVNPDATAPTPDTTAPVITVNGGDVTLTEGDAYIDAGATCTDNVDATCTVATTSNVDANTVGTYTVTYTATDAAGNSSSATRTVTVNPAPVVIPADTTAPVITMNGGDVTLTVGDAYVDAGATCTDNVDATCDVMVNDTVDTTTAGTYTVTYSATDVAGNIAAPVVRNVTVNPAPVACSGTNEVITNAANVRAAIVEIGGGPSNGGLAVQLFQNSTTIVPPLTTSTFFKAGNLISFDGVMVGGVCVTTSATVSAPADTAAPVITMNGGDATLTVGDAYMDAGATCTDNVDTTCTVNVASTVDTATAGTYTVTYSATDAAGNVATPVVRNVTVNPAPVVIPADTTAPVITINGGNASLTAGATYVDAGATCTDNVDATCTVVTIGTVNTTTAGTYTVTYSATDVAGNASTATRTVTVTTPVVVPPTTSTGVVSTGKKAEGSGKITAITPTTITVGTTLLRITPTTVIKLQSNRPLAIGASVEYKGTKNTDASVTASSVKAQ